MDYDIKYMRRCIQLAGCGEAGAPPNPMVGAVVVAEGRIIGEGYHRRCGGPHAEVNAISSVRERHLLPHSTIYVSLEPCAHYGKTPPCADLIIASGIRRVVVGCTDPFAKVNGLGIKKLREAGIETTVGVLEEECRELNRRFFLFHEQQRPWVTLKWAESEDGYMSLPPKGSSDLSRGGENGGGEAGGDGNNGSRFPGRNRGRLLLSNALTATLVHRMRARSAAILVGTNTALADDPSLTTRLWQGPNPIRLTIDRHNALPSSLHIMDGTAPTVVYRDESLLDILRDLHRRGLQTLMVEGGAALLQSFIDQGLWDEAQIETAPIRIGDGLKAPLLKDETLQSEHVYTGHVIRRYRHAKR